MTELSVLDELAALVPPPDVPDPGTKSWDTVFAELGSPLPADFMLLVERYGSFQIGGYGSDWRGENRHRLEYLGVMDPRYAGGSWAKGAVHIGDVYRELREAQKRWICSRAVTARVSLRSGGPSSPSGSGSSWPGSGLPSRPGEGETDIDTE